MRRRQGLAVFVAALAGLAALAACGEDETATTGGGSSESAKARSLELLNRWSNELTPVFSALGERRDAVRARDSARLRRADRKARRLMRPVENYGRDARKQLARFDPSKETRAVTAAGDAWTEWAHTARSFPPQNFQGARRLADLATTALRRHNAAYGALGEEAPPTFRLP